MPTLVSIFDRPQDVVSAVKKLKGRGFDRVETYSPAPFEEIDEAVTRLHKAGAVRRLDPNPRLSPLRYRGIPSPQ